MYSSNEIATANINVSTENNLEALLRSIQPVGTIIPLMPDSPTPAHAFWRRCDGKSEIPPDSELGKHYITLGFPLITPQLIDDRFLMGGKGSDIEIGGENAKVTMPKHFHCVANGSALQTVESETGSPNADSPLSKHTHSETRWSGEQSADNRGNPHAADNRTQTDRTGGPNNVDHNHSVPSLQVLGNIGHSEGGMNGDIDYLVDIRPKYLKVRYFIKIN